MTTPFDPEAILRVLAHHRGRFIVVGGLSGSHWGSPTITLDLDVCYDRARDNLEPLAAAS